MEKKPAPTKTAKEETVTPPPQATVKQPMFNKKFLIIGGGVVAVIVAIVAGMILFGGPTKSDYNDAVTAMKAVRDDYKEIDRVARRASSNSLMSGSTESISAEKELKVYRESADKLKELKALRDKEVKEAYDKFLQKHEKFVPYIEDTSKSLVDFVQMNKTCNAISSSLRSLSTTEKNQAIAEFSKKMQPCEKAIDKLKESKNKTFAEFGDKMSNTLKDLKEVATEMAQANSSSALEMLSVRSKLLKSVRSMGDAMREFSTKMREDSKNYDVADEINTLGKLVVQKYNDVK